LVSFLLEIKHYNFPPLTIARRCLRNLAIRHIYRRDNYSTRIKGDMVGESSREWDRKHDCHL